MSTRDAPGSTGARTPLTMDLGAFRDEVRSARTNRGERRADLVLDSARGRPDRGAPRAPAIDTAPRAREGRPALDFLVLSRMDRPLRVLVVNDSSTVRASLRLALGRYADVEIVGEAADGADAVRLVTATRPSVVLMDVVMPKVDGYAATRAIMERVPTPIVLVSSVVNPRDIRVAMEALRSGALAVTDGLPAPGDPAYPGRVDALVQMLRSMARVRLGKRRRSPPPVVAPRIGSHERGPTPLVIGIAASTGGPQALAALLKDVPVGAAPPILVVQHMSLGFSAGFADWLASTTGHRVTLAEHGRALQRGDVLVAPDDRHLGADAGLRAIVSDEPPIGMFRPSGTWLLRSLARALGGRALGVVLTGMGDDAADGAVMLRAAGGHVIAQDEATSVIYGMPRAAVARGGVDRVLPLYEIGGALLGEGARCEP